MFQVQMHVISRQLNNLGANNIKYSNKQTLNSYQRFEKHSMQMFLEIKEKNIVFLFSSSLN